MTSVRISTNSLFSLRVSLLSRPLSARVHHAPESAKRNAPHVPLRQNSTCWKLSTLLSSSSLSTPPLHEYAMLKEAFNTHKSNHCKWSNNCFDLYNTILNSSLLLKNMWDQIPTHPTSLTIIIWVMLNNIFGALIKHTKTINKV
jgi:hypothetical protein